ncbi:hypothetical protein [Pediococcus damnosus]|uniref:hypothetical protein n=1 Tax=Pediococcus damnosus TaxID=51663 RepID=UPI000704BCCF|nr:hypothetical protein [Pediococcus damnosus]AMV68573.1 Hypothetical protein ADU73_0161 [Pediococcus damnosus]PIO86053.1 hypothetical protein BSQ37_09065 [Pediococcus damnosus]PJE50098.1 hypothetical protein BSQ36_09425 [Pediococcus damnosus]GEA93747.1 hypothetical protein PDA01_16400 [Pediococcus damnosus]
MKIKINRTILINIILDLLFGIFFLYYLNSSAGNVSSGYRWLITAFAAYDFTNVIMSIRKIVLENKKK